MSKGIHRNFFSFPLKVLKSTCCKKLLLIQGDAPSENYKTLLEKTVPFIANRNQKGFSAQSICKYSNKVDPEAKDNVKRFLQRMIRNIDSYD